MEGEGSVRGQGERGETEGEGESRERGKILRESVVAVDGQGHGQGHGQGRGQLTPEKLCLLPCDLDESDDRVLPPGDGEEKREERSGGGRERDTDRQTHRQ